jgi:hypothetical protein
MSDWLKWTAPAAAVVSIASPAYAMQYMSVEEAQKAAFPGASFAEVQAGRIWKASSGGYIYYDHVVGKHLLIDYTVAIGPDGKVRRVDILNYRESYGGEGRDPVVDPPDRRREEGADVSCQPLPLAFGEHEPCWGHSSRSTSLTQSGVMRRVPSKRRFPRSPMCTG